MGLSTGQQGSRCTRDDPAAIRGAPGQEGSCRCHSSHDILPRARTRAQCCRCHGPARAAACMSCLGPRLDTPAGIVLWEMCTGEKPIRGQLRDVMCDGLKVFDACNGFLLAGCGVGIRGKGGRGGGGLFSWDLEVRCKEGGVLGKEYGRHGLPSRRRSRAPEPRPKWSTLRPLNPTHENGAECPTSALLACGR